MSLAQTKALSCKPAALLWCYVCFDQSFGACRLLYGRVVACAWHSLCLLHCLPTSIRRGCCQVVAVACIYVSKRLCGTCTTTTVSLRAETPAALVGVLFRRSAAQFRAVKPATAATFPLKPRAVVGVLKHGFVTVYAMQAKTGCVRMC